MIAEGSLSHSKFGRLIIFDLMIQDRCYKPNCVRPIFANSNLTNLLWFIDVSTFQDYPSRVIERSLIENFPVRNLYDSNIKHVGNVLHG